MNQERPSDAAAALAAPSAADRHRMLAEWNAPALPYDLRQTVHGVFAARAAASPARPALVGAGMQLDYAELDLRAQHMARRLQAAGVAAGHAVGVLLERSPQAIVALLGILKAGAAYVPVQPNFPVDRIAFMLGDAGARLLVSEHAHAAAIPPGLATLWLDDAAPDAATLAPLRPAAVDGDALDETSS